MIAPPRIVTVEHMDQEPWPICRRQYLAEEIHFIRRFQCEFAEDMQQFRKMLCRVGEGARENFANGMQPILERSSDPEVSASAANGPEEIGIGVAAYLELPSVNRYDVSREKVVARRTEHGHQDPFAAAEGETRNSYIGATAHRRGQAEWLHRLVEIAYQRACLRVGDALLFVDFDSLHCGEIDYDAAIAHAESGAAMAAAAYCHRYILSLGKVERAYNVIRTGAAHDQRRVAIKCTIEDQACRFIVRLRCCNDAAGDIGSKLSGSPPREAEKDSVRQMERCCLPRRARTSSPQESRRLRTLFAAGSVFG